MSANEIGKNRGDSADEKDEKSGDERQSSDEPELSDEGKEKVERMQKAYDDDRPTAVMPGTDNTITGVAINEWLDDDGNPKFGRDKQQEKEKENADKQDEYQHQDQEDKEKQREDAD